MLINIRDKDDRRSINYNLLFLSKDSSLKQQHNKRNKSFKRLKSITKETTSKSTIKYDGKKTKTNLIIM